MPKKPRVPILDLQSFFFTSGFFTSVLQRYARVHEVPVDSLMFKYEITERLWLPEDISHERDLDINKVAFHGTSPDDGVRIFGFYLDGAVWEKSSKCLQESIMDERFSSLPEVKIIPVTVRKHFINISWKCSIHIHTSLKLSTL